MSRLNVLLGGVPFGCNNIGDEAILSQVVRIVRDIRPDADITVCTNDITGTPKTLGVSVCPLHGFYPDASHQKEFIEALKNTDVYIWSGATGLSDYPEVGLNSLMEAQRLNVKTVIFCTGMNDTLNPAHFTLGRGIKHRFFTLMNILIFSKIDFIKIYELQKEQRLRDNIKRVLDSCDLVVNRDSSSREQVMRSALLSKPLVAADPVIRLGLEDPTVESWGVSLMTFLERHPQRVGICLSSQQAPKQLEEMVQWLDRVISERNLGIVFIPMNPITDYQLMNTLRDRLVNKEATIIATGNDRPEAVAGLASKMDVIISSRLHLLIFASISATPCVGIGRGSKIGNFLSEFGQDTAGTTDDISFEHMEKALVHAMKSTESFQLRSVSTRKKMLQRLNIGVNALSEVFNACETERENGMYVGSGIRGQ